MSDRAELHVRFPAHGIPHQPAIHPMQAWYPQDHTAQALTRRMRAVRRYSKDRRVVASRSG